jgi:hypothetical protein
VLLLFVVALRKRLGIGAEVPLQIQEEERGP